MEIHAATQHNVHANHLQLVFLLQQQKLGQYQIYPHLGLAADASDPPKNIEITVFITCTKYLAHFIGCFAAIALRVARLGCKCRLASSMTDGGKVPDLIAIL